MRVTLKDIAEKAGVSTSMVSYVLNKRGRVTNEKHKRIIEIANECNYVPNANAKGLVTGISNNIGLVINKETRAMFDSPFILQCISEFSSYLQRYSGWLSLCLVQIVDVEGMRRYLASANFDGIVFLFADYQKEIAELLKIRKTPCVFLDSATDIESVANVCCDDEHGIQTAVDYLASCGHKKIMFLSAKKISSNVLDIRRDAFQAAIRRNHLDYENCFYTGYDRNRIYSVLGNVLGSDQSPTAIVAASDKIAWAVMDYCREKNIDVPNDLSVIGFDNADVIQDEDYGLTTIQQPMYDMVKACVDYIYECQESNLMKTVHAKCTPSLVIRTSVARNNLH